MITNYFCAGMGQFLLPLADPGGFHLFGLVSIILSLALLPVLMTRARAPLPSSPQPGSIRSVYRIAPLGVFGVACAGIVNASFHGMGPVFAREIGPVSRADVVVHGHGHLRRAAVAVAAGAVFGSRRSAQGVE